MILGELFAVDQLLGASDEDGELEMLSLEEEGENALEYGELVVGESKLSERYSMSDELLRGECSRGSRDKFELSSSKDCKSTARN